MEFVSDTIDGYILALAMNETVLEKFAKEADIAPEALRAKVIEEVPKLAKNNGINFDQAKDFLGVYMAMSRFFTNNRSEKDDVFSGVVASRAKKRVTDEFQETFRSIRTLSPSVIKLRSCVLLMSFSITLMAFRKRLRFFLPQLNSQINRLARSISTIVHPED